MQAFVQIEESYVLQVRCCCCVFPGKALCSYIVSVVLLLLSLRA